MSDECKGTEEAFVPAPPHIDIQKVSKTLIQRNSGPGKDQESESKHAFSPSLTEPAISAFLLLVVCVSAVLYKAYVLSRNHHQSSSVNEVYRFASTRGGYVTSDVERQTAIGMHPAQSKHAPGTFYGPGLHLRVQGAGKALRRRQESLATPSR